MRMPRKFAAPLVAVAVVVALATIILLTAHNQDPTHAQGVTTVTIAAQSASHTEADDSASVGFTVSRTGATDADLVVGVAVTQSGDFLDGTPASSLTIPTGQSSARLGIALVDDTSDEPDGSVTATLQEATNGDYNLGSPSQATFTVSDNDEPPLALPDFATTGLQTEVLALFQAGDAGNPPALYSAADSRWTASGSMLAGEVAIGDNDAVITRVLYIHSNGTLRLNTSGLPKLSDYFSDDGLGSNLTLWIQTDDSSQNFPTRNNVGSVGSSYINFSPPTAARTLLNKINADDRFIFALTRPTAPIKVTVTADTATATENVGTVSFTLTRTGDTGSPLTVLVSVTENGDFLTGSTPIVATFPQDASTVTVSVAIDDDSSDEQDGSVTFTVKQPTQDNQYAASNPHTATTTITDDDDATITVELTMPSDAVSGQTANAGISAHNLPAGDYTVTVTIKDADATTLTSSEETLSIQPASGTSETVPAPNDLGYIEIKTDAPTLTQEGATIVVNWNSLPAGVQTYDIYRRAHDCQHSCRQRFQTNGNVTTYRDSSIAHGGTYSYQVRAIYDSGYTLLSPASTITAAETINQIPAPPTGLTGRYNPVTDQNDLSWTAPDPDDHVTGYRIYRWWGTRDVGFTPDDIVTGSTATTYSDGPAQDGYIYIYRISSTGAAGDSYVVGRVRIDIPNTGTLTAPTDLNAVHDADADTVTLSWTAPDHATGLTGYQVFRCRDWLPNGAHCTEINTESTTTSYEDTAVSGTESYHVAALTEAGRGLSSDRVMISID